MTPERARELLPDYVFGTVPEADRAAIDALVSESPELARQVDALREAASLLTAELAPAAPSSKARTRLLESASKDRFLPFVDVAAKLCDLAVERMQDLLRSIDRPGAWEDGPFAGIKLIHFDHGPECLAADTGFVFMPAGFEFPRHRHLGPELNLVLQGRVFDEDGSTYGPGDIISKTADDVHGYRVGEEDDLLLLALNDGFEVL